MDDRGGICGLRELRASALARIAPGRQQIPGSLRAGIVRRSRCVPVGAREAAAAEAAAPPMRLR
jgi:hypothetical protein